MGIKTPNRYILFYAYFEKDESYKHITLNKKTSLKNWKVEI